MKKSLITIGIVAGFLIILGTVYFSVKISYQNQEIELRSKTLAQQKSNEANFDKMFKVIAQVAQVADQYKESFKEIYPKLIEGRYSGEKGNALMKWVTESNPKFETKLYEKLADAIEANRQEFLIEQQKLIDNQREHENLILKFPGSFFLSDIKKIDIKVITSKTTKEVFSTGEENDIELFDSKK